MIQYLTQHNPSWARRFENDAAELKRLLGHDASAIHHIGSTSIPGILAKPILDVLIEAPSLKRFAAQTNHMVANGFEAKGAYGISGRLYFRKHDHQGMRTHHIHVFELNTGQIKEHLVFRDYLRAHADIAQAYSRLKAEMTNNGKTAIPIDYQERKAPFIEAILRDAFKWRGQSTKQIK